MLVAIVNARDRMDVVTIFGVIACGRLEMATLGHIDGAAPVGSLMIQRAGTGIKLVPIIPFLPAGDDIDHPGNGIRAIDGGSRPTDILDTLHRVHRDLV